jgi:hypothetical protein
MAPLISREPRAKDRRGRPHPATTQRWEAARKLAASHLASGANPTHDNSAIIYIKFADKIRDDNTLIN